MSRELKLRFLLAVWGIPLVFVVSYFGGIYFAALIAVISAGGAVEVMRFQHRATKGAFLVAALVTGAGTPLLVHLWGTVPIIPLMLGLILAAGTISVIRGLDYGSNDMLAMLLSAHLFTFPICTMVLIRDSFIWTTNWDGLFGIVYILGGVWIADSAAYGTGKLFGKHQISKTISPKKTIEGTIGGSLGALTWAQVAVLLPWAEFLTLLDRIVVGVCIAAFALVGDLVASMLKRQAGVKDSGNVFPGHGGIYDRFDSVVFTFTAVYLYFLLRGYV